MAPKTLEQQHTRHTGAEWERSLERLRIGMATGEAVMALAATMGSVQLVAGVFAPPAEQLPGFLDSWVLPGIWLFASVAVPSGIAAAMALHRSPEAPQAVMAASAALLVELVVQVPFLGITPLLVICLAGGGALATTAVRANRRGWPG